jgi:bilirubin oxidase
VNAPAPPLVEGEPLRSLSRIASSAGVLETTLTAAPVDLELLPGRRTRVWSYNGAFPGPLLVASEGDRVRVRLVNQLPQQSTLHWHGMPVPPTQDGNPMDPVAPGAARLYEFALPEGSAASYWYHPHPHGVTHEQVFRGLAGAFIVQPRADPLAGLRDEALVFTDLRLDANAAIAPNTQRDFMLGREGDLLLVNGGLRPTLSLPTGTTLRLRLFNCTNARTLRLAFDGVPLTLVGTDGGLIETPVPGLPEVVLAVGERAEVIVRFTGDSTLRALSFDRGAMMGMASTLRQPETLLRIRTEGAAVAAVPVPATLRPVPALPAPALTQGFALGQGMMGGGGMGAGMFTINGRGFDMNRIDTRLPVDTVALWDVANPDGMDHPFHVHGTQFQVVETERSGVVMPAPYRAWKDTVNVRRGETVRLRIRQDMRGLRMYHCHILEHEDQGMMGVLEVT